MSNNKDEQKLRSQLWVIGQHCHGDSYQYAPQARQPAVEEQRHHPLLLFAIWPWKGPEGENSERGTLTLDTK